MNLVLSYWPLIVGLSISGCISGVFAGLLGVGGGVIIVPILSTAFEAMGFSGDIAQHVAVASSLAIIMPTGAMSARSHYRRGAVDTRALRLWAPFVLVGTLVGGLLARWFTGEALRIVFGVLALLIALNVVVPFGGHGLFGLEGLDCIHRMQHDVIERGSIAGVDRTCVSAIRRPR